MAGRPKVLAGILYSGEPTLPRVIAALEAQRDIDLRIILIGRFNQWEAHRRLYHTFNETGTDVDLFVKVDADMVILHERLLATASAFVSDHDELDRISFGVQDWLSGRPILGMHVWRSSVRWLEEPPPLHTDDARTSVRSHLSLPEPPCTLVLHAPEPSDLQATRYAARRALKAAHPESNVWTWRRLHGFIEEATADPVPVRRLAVAAVALAFDDAPRMQGFVLEDSDVENTLRTLRGMAEDWPALGERVVEAVRSGLERAEIEDALPKPPIPRAVRLRARLSNAARHPIATIRRIITPRDAVRPGPTVDQLRAELSKRLSASVAT